MSIVMVPRAQVENPAGNGEKPFPAGDWIGRVDEVRQSGVPKYLEGADFPTQGYSSEDVTTISLQVGSNKPLSGQAEVGERKFFIDFVVADGRYNLSNIDPIAKEHEAWQLQRSFTKIAGLALALGMAEEVEGGNIAFDPDAVVEFLLGDVKGTEIGYSIYHRNYKRKDGTPGVDEQVGGFFPAV